MPSDGKRDHKRDRDATAARVIGAAATILGRDGATALGVNALAKVAGCDKQLIYRYFDGLDGVMAALGAAVATRLADHLAATRRRRRKALILPRCTPFWSALLKRPPFPPQPAARLPACRFRPNPNGFVLRTT